jgi:hypothetical protein
MVDISLNKVQTPPPDCWSSQYSHACVANGNGWKLLYPRSARRNNEDIMRFGFVFDKHGDEYFCCISKKVSFQWDFGILLKHKPRHTAQINFWHLIGQSLGRASDPFSLLLLPIKGLYILILHYIVQYYIGLFLIELWSLINN